MIIGIGGNKRAGKSTAAQILVNKYGFVEISFARPIKLACSKATGVPYEHYEDQEFKEKPFLQPKVLGIRQILDLRMALSDFGKISDRQVCKMIERASTVHLRSPREVMQFVGTELVRDLVNSDYWTDAFIKQALGTDNIVVPDVRFPNERTLIKSLPDSYLIRIDRPGLVGGGDGHVSEFSGGGSSEYMAVFDNSGSISDLQSSVEKWLDGAIKKSNGSGTSSGGAQEAPSRESNPEATAQLCQQEST